MVLRLDDRCARPARPAPATRTRNVPRRGRPRPLSCRRRAVARNRSRARRRRARLRRWPRWSCSAVAGARRRAAAFAFDDVTTRAQQLAKESFNDPRGQVPGVADADHLRPVARHPLPARARAVARQAAALPGAVLPPRPVLRPHRADERRRRRAASARCRSRRATSTTARTTSPAACRRTSASPASASTTRSRSRTTSTRSSSSSAPATSAPSASDQVFGLSARGLAIDTAASVRRGVSRTSASSGW